MTVGGDMSELNNGWTEEIARLQSELEQARRERDEWKATAGHEADGLESWKKVAEKAEAELVDLRGMIEALQDENKKLKSIAAESIDDAVRAEEENRDLKIRYETIVGDHASSLRFIKSIKAELAEMRGRMAVKKVCLCGSSRFVDIMAVCGWLIERDERAVTMGLHLLPGWYPDCPDHHLAEHEGCADEQDALHLKKISLADEIFVVNFEYYVGDSTKRDFEYAKSLGKPIRWFTSDDIGVRVMRMINEQAIKAGEGK